MEELGKMINFKLKQIDEVPLAGEEGNFRMNWFWLTEADLWLTLGDATLYEYSPEAMVYFEDKESAYNDYPLSRFIDDFTELFEEISESIPKEIYQLTDNLNGFLTDAETWKELYESDADEDFYFKEYYSLISWTYKRAFGSGHLIGGPYFSFLRCEDKIRIFWKTEYQLENGIELWKAKDGSIEMLFSDFLNQIKDFGKRFFEQMNKLVQLALEKDWKEVRIDKKELVEEHAFRELDFYKQVAFLEQTSKVKTNWKLVKELNSRMQKELNTNDQLS